MTPSARPPWCQRSPGMTLGICWSWALITAAGLVAPTSLSDVRKTVSMHVIAHQSFDRGYDAALRTALGRAQSWRNPDFSLVFQNFRINATVIRMSDDKPGDILRHFCDDIFNETFTATTILHLINPFEHFRSVASAQYVSNLIGHVGLPVITWGPEYAMASVQNQEESRRVLISPTLHDQAQGMLSLLEQFGWEQFSVVYTGQPGHTEFLNAVRMIVHDRDAYNAGNQQMKDRVRFRQLREIEIRRPQDPLQVNNDLSQLLDAETRIILLFAHEQFCRTIVEAAAGLGLLGREYAWILAFEAIPKTSDNSAENLPIGLLGVQYSSDEKEMKNAVKTAADIWLRALNASAHDLMSGDRPWQLPRLQCRSDRDLFWKDGRRFFDYLRNATKLQIDSPRPTYEPILTIVNTQLNQDTGKVKWEEVGTWNPRGLKMKRIAWFDSAAGPPSGKPERYHLRVVTRPEEPYVIYRNVTENGTCDDSMIPCSVFPRDENDHKIANRTIIKCCTGLSIDLLLLIKQQLNFDVDLYEVEDFQWGNMDKNGKWDGLIRELLDGRADLSVTSLRISEDRATAVPFSEPYLETGITIIVAIRDGAISATAFLEPYDYPSWCLILVCAVHTVGASIFICEWLSPYGMDRGRVHVYEHKFSLFRTFWLMWSMLFGAAVSTDSPRGMTSKFLANIWALFALVFLASYTANLAAFMITKEEYYDLSGIQDWRLQNPLWMKPSFKYGTIPNTSTENNIRKNNKAMYRYMQKYNQQSVEDAIMNLKTQKLHAFIYDATVLEYQAGKDVDCRLITVGNWYAMSGYGIAFRHGSPWLHKINTVILELLQKGEMERLKEFWLAGACHIKQKKSRNQKGITGGVSSSTLGILNFTSAFILLGAGTALAALTFLLEYFLFWFGRRQLSSWDKRGWCALVSMSMGMTLSFQQSVHDALRFHKSHRCRNRVCETQLWKASHQLDMARLEIERLQREIRYLERERALRDAINCSLLPPPPPPPPPPPRTRPSASSSRSRSRSPSPSLQQQQQKKQQQLQHQPYHHQLPDHHQHQREHPGRFWYEGCAEEEEAVGETMLTLTAEVWRYDPETVRAAAQSQRARNGSCRPNTDVYINEDYEEPACPKVTLL